MVPLLVDDPFGELIMQRCVWLMDSMEGRDLVDVMWAVCMYAKNTNTRTHLLHESC